MDQKNAPVHRLVHRFWNVAENFQIFNHSLPVRGGCGAKPREKVRPKLRARGKKVRDRKCIKGRQFRPFVPRTSTSDLLPPLVRQTKGQLQTEAPDPPRKSSGSARANCARPRKGQLPRGAPHLGYQPPNTLRLFEAAVPATETPRHGGGYRCE